MKLEYVKFTQGHFRALLGLCIIMFCTLGAIAQEMTVSGTITDDTGEGVPGATVLVKGTASGTITDIDGNYAIKTKKGDVLEISFIGMATKEIKVTSATHNIVMSTDVEELEELIVIGYGTQKKKELTGAVARVDSEEINQFLSSDLGATIQGRIAGVNVVAGSGEPGEGSNILIRGISSISGNTEPLYVVDGVPQDSDPRIPNTEIQSIDVLKDAASAAIYGTRGANGVILITTRSGQAGDPKVSLEASWGTNNITSDLELMNTSQTIFFESQRAKYVPALAGEIEITRRPEWFLNDTELSGLVQNDGALTQNYNMNVSGGQNNFSYSATVGYYDQEGIMVNSGLKRYNGRLTTRYQKDKTTIRASIGYSNENNDRIDGGLLYWAISYKPYYPEVEFGTDYIDVASGPSETRTNNLLTRLRKINNVKRDRFNGSLDITHELIKGLKLRTVVGGTINNSLSEIFAPPYLTYDRDEDTFEPSDPSKAISSFTTTRQTVWNVNPSISYTKNISGHNMTGLVAFTLNERNQEVVTAYATGIDDPNLSVLNNGLLGEFAENGFNYVIGQASWIGRLQYNYKGKYLFSASVRRDGSSKFAEVNRWGTFPSVSAGWVASDEAFWSGLSKVVNFAKLRASIGTNGNESFSAYSYSSFIQEDFDYVWFDGSYVVGKAQSEFANANVKWETKTQQNFGLDLGLFENKLSVSVDYYQTDNKDMLFPIKLPPSAGAPYLQSYGFDNSVILNVGNMTNNGIEVATNYRLVVADINLNLGATYSRNRNEITEIFGDTEGFFNDNGRSVNGDPNSVVSKMQVGYEAGSFFLYETNGIVKTEEQLLEYQNLYADAELGDLIYIDANDDGVLTTDDQVYAGSALPDFELGFNVSAEYKGFDMAMMWYGSFGNEAINGSAISAYGEGRHLNLVNMWTPENTSSDVPLWVDDHKKHQNYAGTTDLWIEDASFVRLKLISLGYTLPSSVIDKAGFDRVRVYMSAQNPLTFTEYTGYDPEIGGSNIIQKGLDIGRYPVSTQLLFGIQVNF